MAAIKKKFTRPAEEYEITVSLKCEICGDESPTSDNWKQDCYNTLKPTIQLEESSHYPGDYYGTRTHIDLCPTCFEEKLIPWLKAQGGETREVEFGL